MTQKSNNIPVRYKDSPLGIIPQEWEVKRLGDIAQSFSGGTPKAGHKEYYGGEIPFIRSGEIHQINTALYLSRAGMETSSAKMVYKGDLLMALYGANSGDTAISQINGAINQAILCIRPQNMFVEFLQAILEHNKEIFIAKYLQGGQGNLSGEIVNNYYIPLPPLPEQEKIAEILSTWDKAIERQTQLIQKLELRKKGLMQQLLTGKKRLPGFTGEWEKVKLGEIGDTYNGLTGKAKEDFETGNARYIPYINVFSNERIVLNGLLSVKVYPDELQNLVQFGDVFFTVSSETPNEVGMSSVLLDYLDNTYLNSFCFGYRMKNFTDLSPVYAMYLFRSRSFRKKMVVLSQGSTRYNISKKEVLGIIVKIPSLQEQTAIANILSLCDEEIRLAQDKLAAMKEQKKGFMQVLLTGKRRVKL